MIYTKNSWSTGDTITAAKLNHLEQGVYDASEGAGGTVRVPFEITVDGQGNMSATTVADYSEVRAAAIAGRTVIADCSGPGGMKILAPLWGFNDTDLFFAVLIMPDSGATAANYYSMYWSAVQVLFVPKTMALS